MGKTWNCVEEVFSAAMELPAAQRVEYVRSQCDGAARDEVLALLQASGNMGEFLLAPLTDFRGQAFGPYLAEREIGRGGMSVVYEGRRVDGDFEKRVAIKVVLVQTAGETKILAGLEHPNIARLLDAGTNAFGFSYLVMEFVDGTPITSYAKSLIQERKLRLFLQVCAGVQYAHRSLVVHRDLKPDNILVTADGTAKLLDFGIAKLLDAGAQAQTAGVRAYTVDYASPEQILGRPVTTSADVYSLGVLLCELLGGRVPRQLTGLDLGELVNRAGQDVARDIPIGGDLGVIAGKALRLAPEDRYESAGALARDVENYLKGMPVEARAPSLRYQLGKFVTRNRWAVAGVAAAGIALAAAGLFAFRQAQLAALRFDQVHALSRSVMFEMHDAVRPLAGSLAARQLIVTRSLGYLDALSADASAPEQVQLDVVRGYLRMADIQGKDLGGASVGKSADALESARRAVAVGRRLFRRTQAPEVRRALVDALLAVASASGLRGLASQGTESSREAVQLARGGADKRQLAFALKQLADSLEHDTRNNESIGLLQESLAIRKQVATEAPNDGEAQQRFAEAHHWLAATWARRGNFSEAEGHAREAYRLDKIRYEGPDRRQARANLAADIGMLAAVAGRKKAFEEARRLYAEQLEIRREIYEEDPKSVLARMRVAASLDRLGRASFDSGHVADAVRYGEAAVKELREILAADPGNKVALQESVYALVDLAMTWNGRGSQAKACAYAREALRLLGQPSTEAFRRQMASFTAKAKGYAANCAN